MASDERPEVFLMDCNPFRGERHALKCRSCGFESDDLDDFNMSTCWECCHRITWSDACQQEKHAECASGDPDDPEFCPCPCHDQNPPDRAVTASPPADAASPWPPSSPLGGQGTSRRVGRGKGLPVQLPPAGRQATKTPSPSSDPVPRGGLDGEGLGPVLPIPVSGTGRGQVEPPRLRLAPSSRAAPGEACTAPGATAGVPLATPEGTPAQDAPVRHLVQFSTGVASAEVAWRVVAEYGADNVSLLTADTRAEDEDNWRFGREVADRLGCEWIILADGRTPMEVGRDRKCVPNNHMAVCSQVLKRDLLDKYRGEHFDPAGTIVYLGYDWTEMHRVEAARVHWAPWTVECPLTQPPHLWKEQIHDLFRERGIEPPRLYKYGFAHANCGGACVRGGQAQWGLLLQVNRTRYLDWEAEEEKTRGLLGKDVSILRDRTGGESRPLSLATFRKRIERQPGLFDADDWGACGCLMDGSPVSGMDGAP